MYEEICSKYDLKGVINASGKMTTLGTSILSEDVKQNCNTGYSNFFVMDQLHTHCNKYIAEMIGVEAACITASTSSGIVLAISSMKTKSDINNIENLYDLPKAKVLILKGHMVNFGTPIKTLINGANAQPIEVGSVNRVTSKHLENAITPEVTCGLFVKSHHCVQKSMLELKEFVDVCHKHNIPVIVDASAEEDLYKYYNEGADIVIYSGAKAISGPTTGICIGKSEYIQHLMPQFKGIGRAMKVGKEGILGITKAIENYISAGSTADHQKELSEELISKINRNSKYNYSIVQDKAGREIFRVQLSMKAEQASLLAKYLKSQNPCVETRDHELNLGNIQFDMRAISSGEIDIIAKYINNFFKGE